VRDELDGPSEDPREIIPRLVERWRAGFDVGYAVREQREGATWLEKATSSLFLERLVAVNPAELPC
jgi:hypothetical protein